MLNCIIIDDDLVVRSLLEDFIKKSDKLKLMGSFDSSVKALSKIDKSRKVDLIFLDIEMPEMSGLELLENLNKDLMTIVISGNEKYALDAFNHNVVDYLLKPFSLARFLKSVDRAIELKNLKSKIVFSESRIDDDIFIKDNSKLVKVNFSEIVYVEAKENYVSIQTNKKRYMIHYTMKAIEKVLPVDFFARVHRSYYVNIKYIKSIYGSQIDLIVDDKTVDIPIGKSYRAELLDKLNLIN